MDTNSSGRTRQSLTREKGKLLDKGSHNMFENALDALSVSVVDLYQSLKKKVKQYQAFASEGRLQEYRGDRDTELTPEEEEERGRLMQTNPMLVVNYIRSTFDVLLSLKLEEDLSIL